jgi:hypothetical protein
MPVIANVIAKQLYGYRLSISTRALANARQLSRRTQVDTTATHRLYLMHVNVKRMAKPCIVQLLVHEIVDWGSYD